MHDAVADIARRADYVSEDSCHQAFSFDLFFVQVDASYTRDEPDCGPAGYGGWDVEAKLIGGEIYGESGERVMLTREQVIDLIGKDAAENEEQSAGEALAAKRERSGF
jgi:hypothetical protein